MRELCPKEEDLNQSRGQDTPEEMGLELTFGGSTLMDR